MAESNKDSKPVNQSPPSVVKRTEVASVDKNMPAKPVNDVTKTATDDKTKEPAEAPQPSVINDTTSLNVQTKNKPGVVDNRNEGEVSALARSKEANARLNAQADLPRKREHPEAALSHTARPEVPEQPTNLEPRNSVNLSALGSVHVQPTDIPAGKTLATMTTDEKDALAAKAGVEPAQAVESGSTIKELPRNGALENDERLTNKGSRKA